MNGGLLEFMSKNTLQLIENQLKSVLKCLIINLNQQKQVPLRTLSAFLRQPFKHPFYLIDINAHVKCPLIFFINIFLTKISKHHNRQRILLILNCSQSFQYW